MGANRYSVSFELADAAAHGRLLLAKDYQVNGNELRALGHHISDEVYQKLTGERGIFSTRIAYILVQRSGDKARYTLDVADVDGSNPQSLLVSTEPIFARRITVGVRARPIRFCTAFITPGCIRLSMRTITIRPRSRRALRGRL